MTKSWLAGLTYMTEKSFQSDISDNYSLILQKVHESMKKAGRNSLKSPVRIMAVTKTVNVTRINEAVLCGINLLGENRVQEFLEKSPEYAKFGKNTEVHFIGGLQSNKIRKIVDKVAMIHSVDGEKCLSEIDRQSGIIGKVSDVLIEVNVGEEVSKCGVAVGDVERLSEQSAKFANVRLRGLMAIPPPQESERGFEVMAGLFERCRKSAGSEFDTLSMGMSGDYEKAILYGANIIRLGSALFGSRVYNNG